MRTLHTLAITATVTAALLTAGCNMKKNRPGVGNNDPYTVGQGEGLEGPDGFRDEFGNLIADSKPFDSYKDLVSNAITGLEVVYFGFDSSTLPSAELHKIDRAAAYLQNNPSHVMIIEGHCDERGSAEYNLSLGEFRAQAVRNYMVNLGIAGNRLQTRSFGFEKPAVIGSGEAVWRQNRRAVFAVYK